MEANYHPNESQRRKSLAEIDILDTPAEREFDDIVLLAQAICETPIALISFVAEDRQWFKSRIGLDETETPRFASVCAHAILGDKLLEIPDTREDIRTADNPLVGNHVDMKFYAGMPFSGPGGDVLGTLCLLDHQPRTLTDWQRTALTALAHQVEKLIELRLAAKQARLAQHRAEEEKATLAAMHQYLMLLNQHVPVMIAQISDEERYLFANARYADFFGLTPEDIIGESVDTVLGESGYRSAHPYILQALGGEVAQHDLEITDAKGRIKTLMVRYAPELSANNEVYSIIAAVSDVTERKELETHRALLLNELEHRVKNSLATLSVIARQSARRATSIEGFLETFTGRLRAIDTAHAILTNTTIVNAGLRALINGQVEPYVDIASGRLRLQGGDDVQLSAQCAHALGLVLHELTTNALKHGALSNDKGFIDLRWQALEHNGMPCVNLIWTEKQGPVIAKPNSKGFGSTLIESMLSHNLNGRVRMEYLRSGLIAELLVPTSSPTVGMEAPIVPANAKRMA